MSHSSLSLVCALFLASPLAAEGAKPTMVAHSASIQLNAEQTKAYRAFKRRGAYHGAFVVNTVTGHGYWMENFHRLDAAKSAVLKLCHELSDKQGRCQLYAASFPQGESPEASQVLLSKEAATVRSGRYQAKQTRGKYGAFAISGATEYGMTWGWDSRAEARDGALARCEAYVVRSLANLNIEGRRWAKAEGLDKCRIFDEVTPSE